VEISVDELATIEDPADLAACSLPELRGVRDAYRAVENGLSYVRRIVQGRFDIVSILLERRADGQTDTDLVALLPESLSEHLRGSGLPRPPQDLEPPAWTDDIVGEADRLLPPGGLGALVDQSDADLRTAADRLGALEREVSRARREAQVRMDRIQEEIVHRYQDGASVDDLLA